MKKERGITLIALVITIIILIILATISINIVFNGDGMINQAEKAKEHQANAEAHDQEKLELLDDNIKEYISENNNNGYIDSQLITSPNRNRGMIPIKWNGTAWVKTTAKDSNWYNYENKQWANVVLKNATFNGDVLDETKPYSQFVWIPRFAYKITSGWHSNEAGTIEVVFVGTDNKGKDGVVYNGSYSDAVAGVVSGGSMNNFVVNPAFDYGREKLQGIWIGKFESSHTSCTTDITTGQVAFTGNEVMQIKPNVTSWRNITIGDAFTTCLNMNSANNIYGLSIKDNVVDPHLMKNTEWGAVAYLSKSKYGKETEEVFINNSSDYITGNAGNTVSQTEAAGVTNAYHTEAGQKASTTGNIYGVYDMSGGSWETVAGYVNNHYASLTQYGGDSLTSEKTPGKYKDIYNKGSSDTQELNYGAAAVKYGDAIYETSNGYNSPNTSWYGDYSGFPYSNNIFFVRGDRCGSTTNAGLYFFGITPGNASSDFGFRTCITTF